MQYIPAEASSIHNSCEQRHSPDNDGTQFRGDVTRAQFVRLAIALCMGTLVEWCDFTVYSQLANTITKVFFPSNDPAVAQLSFWGVYAVGFISRPAGAVLFGHLGDFYGRRLTLLLSILFITIPTLLIGCLPTFAHIGIAAPILMAILRAIQGMAVGGEFGSAITYLYEMAPDGRKGVIASLGAVATSPGIILGIIMCLAVLYGCTPEQLLIWGWRIPFLLTAFTAPFALVMRMHMPEPDEYLQNKQVMVVQRVASTAAQHVAKSFVHQHSRRSSLPALSSSGGAAGTCSPSQLSIRQVSLRLQRSLSITCEGALAGTRSVTGAAPGVPASFSWKMRAGSMGSNRKIADGSMEEGAVHHDSQSRDVAQGHKQQGAVLGLGLEQHQMAHEDDDLPLGCEQEFEEEVQQLSAVIKHHVPLQVLFRDHWKGVLLQFLLEANYGAAFYTFFSWVPPYLSSSLHVPMHNTLWAVLIGMVLFGVTTVLTGHFIGDSKIPKVWALLGATVVITVATFPVLICLQSNSPVGMWLLQPVMLGLVGLLAGTMTTIGPQIYPAAVRASGYNIGHNLAMSLFGGLSPLVISALAVVLQPAAYAAGVVVILTALVTFCAGVALIKVVPATNAACAAGAHQQVLHDQAHQQQQQQGMELQKVAVGN